LQNINNRQFVIIIFILNTVIGIKEEMPGVGDGMGRDWKKRKVAVEDIDV